MTPNGLPASTGRARRTASAWSMPAAMILDERAFAHGGAGLAELCAWLLAMTGAAPTGIAVAIAFADPGGLGRRRRGGPQLEEPIGGEIVTIANACSRLANRVREQLWRYYPQAMRRRYRL